MADERPRKTRQTEENTDADAARDSSLSQDLATSLVMVLQEAMASQDQRDKVMTTHLKELVSRMPTSTSTSDLASFVKDIAVAVCEDLEDDTLLGADLE